MCDPSCGETTITTFPFPHRKGESYRSESKVLTDRKDFLQFEREYLEEQHYVQLERGRINALEDEMEKAQQLTTLVLGIKEHLPQPKKTIILIDALLKYHDLGVNKRVVVCKHLDLLLGTHTQHHMIDHSKHAEDNDITWILYTTLRQHKRMALPQKLLRYQQLDEALGTTLHTSFLQAQEKQQQQDKTHIHSEL